MTAKDWLEKIPEECRKFARQYAIMKCEEQRDNCVDKVGELLPLTNEHMTAIRNSPEPTFD